MHNYCGTDHLGIFKGLDNILALLLRGTVLKMLRLPYLRMLL